MNTKKVHQTKYDVIVVGGGPSGMMAAGRAGEKGKKVLLIEKNKRLGEKLRISGGGRCNITNGEEDLKVFLKRYGGAEQFLYSAFSIFGNSETFSFFASRGLPLIVEAGKRAFPETQKAGDVEKVMEGYCKESGVTILTNTAVEKIITENNLISGVVAGGITYACDGLVLATGGTSHKETGSTGDGFRWLQDLGHTIADPTPAIVPIAVSDAWVKSLAGVSLDQMKMTFYVSGEKQFSKTGRILFTHFGLSGPLVLNSAKQVGDLLHEGVVTGTIDLFPKKEVHILDQEILEFFDANKNKTFKNVCKEFVPPGMSGVVLSLLESELVTKKVHSVTREERREISVLLKTMSFTVKDLMGHDRAVVADGGILISEIDMRTMKSLKYENLCITGDLLHINRPTGGFSLQLCWTTGFVAGENA